MSRYHWRPYVPVARRRALAAREMDKLRRKGGRVCPIVIEGRAIARTFWGRAWCEHLEKFSDYANRLPRGRTYVRNGSVCHLEIAPGCIAARVSGSELYSIEIAIAPLSPAAWESVKRRCAGRVGSLLELLQGRLSAEVMAVVTDREHGLFPSPKEISLDCSCPDWADMCKHVAAVMYGVGARLDEEPELLFRLRGVDHTELVATDVALAPAAGTARARIADTDLGDVFGIDIDTVSSAPRRGDGRTRKRPGTASAPTRVAPAAVRPAAVSSPPSSSETPDARPRGGCPPKAAIAPRPPDPGKITGEALLALRTRVGASRAQLARVLKVSSVAVALWEKKRGPLNLQARTHAACAAVLRMTDDEIRETLATPPRSRRDC